MYPAELEIKDSTESTTSASYLHVLSIRRDGQLHTSIYDKRDDFNFHITNFPFLSSNIRSSPILWRFYLSTYMIRPCLVLVWMFYSEGQVTFHSATQTGISCGTLEIIFQEVLWSIRGSNLAIWSIPLTNVKWHSDPWPTVTSQPIKLSTNFITLIQSLTFTELWVVSMEYLQQVWHASRERLPFRTPVPSPFWDLLVFQLLRPDSSNLPCLY